MFDLASHLGMTVARLQEELGEDEIYWWMARANKRPLRDDDSALCRQLQATFAASQGAFGDKKRDRVKQWRRYNPEADDERD